LQLERRRRRLTSGIAVLRVGAATEVELKEKLDRVDDAVNATRVAALYGILPGGGDALLRASYNLRDEADLKTGATRAAYEVIAGAIQRPSRVILENACYNVESVLEQFTDKNFVSTSKKEVGFNALSGEFVDLVASGVIDPYYVTKSSLINSLSVAKKVLEVGCVINTGYNTLEDENV
jgi:chaperonin GroEL